MKQIDKVIKYVDDIWMELQRNKSEYANEEIYAKASRSYCRSSIFKMRVLRNKLFGCMHIIEEDLRQDARRNRPRLICAVVWMEYCCKKYKNFMKYAYPVMLKDFPAFKEFSEKVYDVTVVKEELPNVVHY